MGYSRDEVERLGREMPTRGMKCPRCGVHIPEFEELSEDKVAALKALAHAKPIEALKELRRLTGCSLLWAKVWAHHAGEPAFPFKPCPYCGQALRSDDAKQCLVCGMDWHRPERLLRNGKAVDGS